MKFKKWFAISSALCICLSMAGCGESEEKNKPAETTAATTIAAAAETAQTEEAATTAAAPETTTESATTTEKETTAAAKEDEPATEDGIVKVILKSDEVDITKPYTADVPLGEGKAVFAYPMNSLLMKVYEAPSDEAAVVSKLPAGADITAYVSAEYSHTSYPSYLYIRSGDIEGWCMEENVRDFEYSQKLYDDLKTVVIPENCYDLYALMYVLPESIEIKKSPDEDSDTLGVYDKNTSILVLGDNGSGWYYVEFYGDTDERFGWVKQDSGHGYDSLYIWEEYTEKYYELYHESPERLEEGITVDKPVIYLYPEEEMQVDVKLTTNNAQLWTTYPKYDNGWSVTATPDGKLTDKDGHNYDYLFWDAKDCNIYDMSKGFCVKGEDTVDFLREKLTFLGLNEMEMNEFITYWLPKMEHNEYNLVAFRTTDYERNFPLSITPQPDSMLRVFMTYKSVDEYTEIEPQKLESFERKGFTVVEWGGEELGENFIR